MKSVSLIIVFYLSSCMLNNSVLAINGSFCCWDNEEIWVDHDDFNKCLNTKTNAIANITLNCTDSAIIPIEFISHKLNNDGSFSLIGEMFEELAIIEKGKFCLGNQLEDGDSNISVVVLCLEDNQLEAEVFVSPNVLGSSFAVSSVFFALTAIVYQTLPEIRDLQGKSIVSLCATQAFADLFLSILILMEHTDMTWCAVKGYLAYFFLESSFFWMNALAIQVLITMKHTGTCNDGWKQYKLYALYAWGAPAILTLILIVVNYHPGSHKRPGIGLNGFCWFLDEQRTWIFLYSVMAIILMVNLGIFVYVSVYLWKCSFSSNHYRTLRFKCIFMFRLFIVLGLSIVFELVSSLLPMNMFWAIIDILNSIQGIIVFLLLVVFRKRVLKALLHRRNQLLCLNETAAKYLNETDDEDEIVTPTMGVPLDERGIF